MLNFMLKTILCFTFLFGRSWLTVCANKITTVFSYWLDSSLLCSVKTITCHHFPNIALHRGPYAVRSGLNTSISIQAEQRQRDADVALIGHTHFEVLQAAFKDSGFSLPKITTVFGKRRVCANVAGGLTKGKEQSCFPDYSPKSQPGSWAYGSSSRI